jgi:hypothetical protein
VRLEEWQKFIESQFLEDKPEEEGEREKAKGESATPSQSRSLAASLDSGFRGDRQVDLTPDPSPGQSLRLPGRGEKSRLEAPLSPAQREPGEELGVRSLPPSQNEEPAPEIRGEGHDFRHPTPDTLPELDAEVPPFAHYLPPYKRVGLEKPELKANGRVKQVVSADPPAPSLPSAELWAAVPKHVQTLLALERQDEEEVAQNSYKRPFAEKRRELIERILDPILSLEDTARLLNVCPATVRRYTNKGILNSYRKEPERSQKSGTAPEKETRQRRFRLSDILAFLEAQQALIEQDSEAAAREETES